MWFTAIGWTLVGFLLLNAFSCATATGQASDEEISQIAKGIMAFILIGYAIWTIIVLLGGI